MSREWILQRHVSELKIRFKRGNMDSGYALKSL